MAPVLLAAVPFDVVLALLAVEVCAGSSPYDTVITWPTESVVEMNTKPLVVVNGCALRPTVTSCVCVWPFDSVVINVAVVSGASLSLPSGVPAADPAAAVVDPVDPPAALPVFAAAEVGCAVTDACIEVEDAAGFDWGGEA